MCSDGPEMPTIMGPSVVKAGLNTTLTCNASSNPPAHYKWYFNDSIKADTAKFATPLLTEDWSGIYTCMAYNNVTGQNNTAQKMLTVVGESRWWKMLCFCIFFLLTQRNGDRR